MTHTIATTRKSPLWVYEDNFRLLNELAPDLGAGDRFVLEDGPGGQSLAIEVSERCKYTYILEVVHYFSAGNEVLADLRMRVRLYFDAQVAEVTGYQDCARLPARYEVKSPGRFHRGEKRQTNELLNHLLRHCLRRSYLLSESGY